MSFLVRHPNLPIRTKKLILGRKYADFLQIPLEKLGISTLFVPDNPHVDARLSGHADLSVFHAGGEKWFLAPYLVNSDFHAKMIETGVSLEFLPILQSKEYPYDACLNACAVGDDLFYSSEVTAKEIVNYFTNKKESRCISVRQGYAKCSVCVVDAHSIITGDSGIAAAAQERGYDVLCIRPGYIDLPGFDYGFIGGAAFRLSDKLVAFTGSLDAHPDKSAILDFIASKGFEPVFLTEKNIFDIGSALPLAEY